MMQGALRAEDLLARCGGDEFAIVARGIELTDAGQLGELAGRYGVQSNRVRFQLPSGMHPHRSPIPLLGHEKHP